MRQVLALIALTAAFSTMALADSWTGRLLDASCVDQQSDAKKAPAACSANDQTASFAIEANGEVYKLDAAGNTQAATALRNRADRSAPGKGPSTITAMVEGSESGGTIKAEKVEVQ